MYDFNSDRKVYTYTPDYDLEDKLKYIELDSVHKCPLGIGLIPEYLQDYGSDNFSDLFRLHPPRKTNIVNFEHTNPQTGVVEIDTKRPFHASRWCTSYSGNTVDNDEVSGFTDSFWGISMEDERKASFQNTVPAEEVTFDLPYQFQPFETYVKHNFSDAQGKFRRDGKGYYEYNQIVVDWFEDADDYIPLQFESTRGAKHNSIVTIFLTEGITEQQSRMIRFVPKPRSIGIGSKFGNPVGGESTNLINILDVTAIHGTILTTGSKLEDLFLHANLKIGGRRIARAISITFKSRASDSNG